MAKEPSELKWVESLLPEDFRRRPMFGGFSYYVGEKMVLALFESTQGSRSYKGQVYDFDLWRGCMFPVEKEYQDQALRRFPFLHNHPILPKWLYLPVETEGFDDLLTEVMAQATKPTGYWGAIPTRKAKKANRKVREEKIPANLDTRTPRMFSDEPAAAVLERAVKVSDLRNLGPTTEASFQKVGIKTAAKFIELGWKKTLVKLVAQNPKHRHSLFAYALIGALKNQDWMNISESDKNEAREFVKSLKPENKKKIP